MRILYADLETRSRADLKAVGHVRYAYDPSTRITTAAWLWKGGNRVESACNIPGLEHLGSATMQDFIQALTDADMVIFHNADFDITVIMATIGPCGLLLNKISCTMARAQAVSMPGGLDQLCKALGVPGKSPDGHTLVMATCKPKRDGTFEEDPHIFRALLAYNVRDVECLTSVDERLPHLNVNERPIWERTWRKNKFGLPLDMALAQAIAARREAVEAEVAAELLSLTKGFVTALSQRGRLIDWFAQIGYPLVNTRKETVELALDEDIERMPYEAYRVLTLMSESGGMAPTKAQALLDRQLHGIFFDATRFFGARSGRGTSEGVNTFNFARPTGKHKMEPTIERIKRGEPASNIELSDVLRGMIVAPPGYKVVDVDFANGELRGSLWFAGDDEFLKVIASGEDPYAFRGRDILGIPDLTKKTHPRERQACKKIILGGGYQIGGNRYYLSFKTDPDIPLEMRKALTLNQSFGMVEAYRKANPKLVALWKALDEAGKRAVYSKGSVVEAANGKLRFFMQDDDTLLLILPSGRMIPHYDARISEYGELEYYRAKHGRMMRCKTYGGAWLEIACQATLRDALTYAEAAIERELPDVTIMLDIYDSIVCLAPSAVAEQRMQQIVGIMSRDIPFLPGLPNGADGYFADRMMK